MNTRTRRVPRSPRKPPASYHPHNVTVLGIDTANVSGWAVRVRGRLTASGQLDTKREAEVAAVVARAQRAAAVSGTRLVVVLEKAFGGRLNTVLGLGAARERWRRALALAKHAQGRIAFVVPNEWRAVVLGRGWVGRERDVIRACELTLARAETGLSDIGPDEAAAILISRWAAHSPRVADHLDRSERAPKPRSEPDAPSDIAKPAHAKHQRKPSTRSAKKALITPGSSPSDPPA